MFFNCAGHERVTLALYGATGFRSNGCSSRGHPWVRDLQVPDRGGQHPRLCVVGAPLVPRSLEDLEVPVFGNRLSRPFVLEVFIVPRPLEDLEVPVIGSFGARPFVPVAALSPCPLEDLEVLLLGSTRARCFVPRVPVGLRPLQDRDVPAACRERAENARKHFSRDLDIALGFRDLGQDM